MDNDRLIKHLKGICQAPEPERKESFFLLLEERGLVSGRFSVINHGEFLLRQFFYIGKWVWLWSGIILLGITAICCSSKGDYPFALTPLLAAGILVETGRSFRWKMAELEYTARFSLRSVMLARMFLLGTIETAGLLAVILIVRPWYPFSLGRVFLYMMVPYLSAALSGSVYERKHRSGSGWGSIIICLLSSGFFAVAPYWIRSLYDERNTIVWLLAFVLLMLCLGRSVSSWFFEMEEPIWSL